MRRHNLSVANNNAEDFNNVDRESICNSLHMASIPGKSKGRILSSILSANDVSPHTSTTLRTSMNFKSMVLDLELQAKGAEASIKPKFSVR